MEEGGRVGGLGQASGMGQHNAFWLSGGAAGEHNVTYTAPSQPRGKRFQIFRHPAFEVIPVHNLYPPWGNGPGHVHNPEQFSPKGPFGGAGTEEYGAK